MSFVDPLTLADVTTEDKFIEYARQRFGVPCFRKDINVFKGAIRAFMADNPRVGYDTLARGVDWGKSQHRRPRNLQSVMYYVADAYKAGVLPELDDTPSQDIFVGQTLDEGIAEALQIETDPAWRRRLFCSEGQARKRVFIEWVNFNKQRMVA